MRNVCNDGKHQSNTRLTSFLWFSKILLVLCWLPLELIDSISVVFSGERKVIASVRLMADEIEYELLSNPDLPSDRLSWDCGRSCGRGLIKVWLSRVVLSKHEYGSDDRIFFPVSTLLVTVCIIVKAGGWKTCDAVQQHCLSSFSFWEKHPLR